MKWDKNESRWSAGFRSRSKSQLAPGEKSEPELESEWEKSRSRIQNKRRGDRLEPIDIYFNQNT